MDNEEAKRILKNVLQIFRDEDYLHLKDLIDSEPVVGEISGGHGAIYQYEIQVFLDDQKSGNIRVTASIDDGGIKSLVPLSEDFIKDSNNNFVGE